MNINKTLMMSVLFAVFFGLAGCSSTPDEEYDRSTDNVLEMPNWYVERTHATDPGRVYGYGASAPEPDYPDQMRRQAYLNATQEIAAQVQQVMDSVTSSYFDRRAIGSGDDQRAQIREEVRSTVEQRVNVEMTGISFERTQVTSDGRWVVMAVYDLEQDFDRYLQAMDLSKDDPLIDELWSETQSELDRSIDST